MFALLLLVTLQDCCCAAKGGSGVVRAGSGCQWESNWPVQDAQYKKNKQKEITMSAK